MREWGWTNPILIDEDGGIIAGHGRVLAARKLGLEEAPVMIAQGWTEAQKRAYVIADNKLALNSGWDDELLAAEIHELNGLDFNIELMGFSGQELDLLMFDNDIKSDEQNGDDSSVEDETKFLLMLEFSDEAQLMAEYERAVEEGYSCKIIE